MTRDASVPVPRRRGRLGALVFGLALGLYLATTGGSMATDVMSYEVTKAMVERGSVAMSYNVYGMDAHRGVDGQYYAPYAIGHAVYAIPFYGAARLAERWSGLSVGKPDALTKAGFVAGSAVAAALVVWIAFLFASEISGDLGAAVGTALTVGFATFLWPYAKFGFSAPLAALAVLWGTYGVWVGVRRGRPLMLAIGGAGLGAALLVRHELALVSVPVGLWILAESSADRRLAARRIFTVALPVVAAVAITLVYNQVRFGNPLDTGYLRDQTVASGAWWEGLVGQLASRGDSVFLYSPVLLAGVFALGTMARRDLRTALLLVGEGLVLLVFYASFTHWDAERSYGPRYLLPVVPLLVLPVSLWWTSTATQGLRRALTAMVVLSALVQVPGVLVDFSKVAWAPEVSHYTWQERRWTFEASTFRLNLKAAVDAVPSNVRYLTGMDARPAVRGAEGDARDFSDQFGFSLDFWWLYLFYLRVVSAPVATLLGLLPLAASGWCGWRILRELRACAPSH